MSCRSYIGLTGNVLMIIKCCGRKINENDISVSDLSNDLPSFFGFKNDNCKEYLRLEEPDKLYVKVISGD